MGTAAVVKLVFDGAVERSTEAAGVFSFYVDGRRGEGDGAGDRSGGSAVQRGANAGPLGPLRHNEERGGQETQRHDKGPRRHLVVLRGQHGGKHPAHLSISVEV